MPTLKIEIPPISRTGDDRILPPEEFIEQVGALVLVRVGAPTTADALLATRGNTLAERIYTIALIDTGAMRTTVDESIIQRLGIPRKDETLMVGVGAPEKRDLYSVEIEIVDLGTRFALDAVSAKFDPVLLYRALIGRDILRSGKLFYNGQTGQVYLSLNL